jgi:hypothetical protein
MAATPRCHTDDEDDDNKVYPTKKVLFVDSYGVKSLPYRGRRKHFQASVKLLVAAQTDTMIYLEWPSSNLSGNTQLA